MHHVTARTVIQCNVWVASIASITFSLLMVWQDWLADDALTKASIAGSTAHFDVAQRYLDVAVAHITTAHQLVAPSMTLAGIAVVLTIALKLLPGTRATAA